MYLFRFSCLFLLILFFGCEKSIEIDVNFSVDQLVVEGYIQQGYPSYVFLTRSESYFNSIDSNVLNNISVNTSIFSNGVYLYSISNGLVRSTKRLIVHH